MKATKTILLVGLLFMTVSLTASGPVGIYGIIEKVVFEPNEQAPERIQVWGAFAYVDGAGTGLTISEAQRGYLYFKGTNKQVPGVELKEWNDLKAVAGTGQAVAFGRWLYSGSFTALRPDSSSSTPPHIFASAPGGGSMTDMRVRPGSEKPGEPATYQTNSGVVKLPEQGSHSEIVKALKSALKK